MTRYCFIYSLVLFAATWTGTAPAAGQTVDDAAAVESAVRDYLLGIYDEL